MTFSFFTFGGMQFWEDVLFSNNWRIQHNIFTNKYRLLDNWNIRRCSGTMEQCQKSLAKYREIFQFEKSNKPIVILLHSMLNTSSRFAKMRQEFENAGFSTAAINYPSTRKNLNGHIKQIDSLLDNMDLPKESYFVTQGIGGIIARELSCSTSGWTKKTTIRRIVQINPPNQGSKLLSAISKFRIVKWLLGPMTQQYDSQTMAKIVSFPKNIEFGIICTYNSVTKRILSLLPKSWEKLFCHKDDAFLIGSKDAVNIKISNLNSCNNQKVINACIMFLRKGSFGI